MPTRLTRDEFKTKLEELIAQVPEDDNVFIIIHNDDGKDIETNGYGCPACSTELILRMIMAGSFKHNGPNEPTKGN